MESERGRYEVPEVIAGTAGEHRGRANARRKDGRTSRVKLEVFAGSGPTTVSSCPRAGNVGFSQRGIGADEVLRRCYGLRCRRCSEQPRPLPSHCRVGIDPEKWLRGCRLLPSSSEASLRAAGRHSHPSCRLASAAISVRRGRWEIRVNATKTDACSRAVRPRKAVGWWRCLGNEVLSMHRITRRRFRSTCVGRGWLLCAAVLPVLSCGASNKKQEQYCAYTVIKLTCESRADMQRDFTVWPGRGKVISIDDGPWETTLGPGDYPGQEYGCCYLVTYEPDGSW